jgi:predicted AlkP superfamily pyrophosphatase or phosphodiesterase
MKVMDLVCVCTAGKLGKKNMLFRSVLAAVVSVLIALAVTSPVFAVDAPRRARLILVLIVDGLRPDSINRGDTPNLYRLRQEGVNYLNAHAVFPTVTRVNSAAISTGTYPGANGLVSNSMFVPEVHPTQPFNTGDFRQLLKLAEVSGGNLLFAKSLGERLQERGLLLAAVSSGSTGNALLSNHLAPQGVGILVNGNFEPGKRVAYPDSVNAVILSRFGAAPAKEDNALVDWTDNVLREYILPELKPDVIFDWLTEPDTAQHSHGVGSKVALEALRNSDRNIGLTLKKLESLGLINQTDIIVVSDHGFSLNTYGVNVTQELIRAGLKSGSESDDVVVVSNGQSVLLHVKDRNPQYIRRIVRYLQEQNWTDVVFTAGQNPSSRVGQTSKRR